ncbi:MAG: AIR synthase family protein [Acidobacteria bacterium]|nr:AIR synthase family protein [Acidobacteriota bacterium]
MCLDDSRPLPAGKLPNRLLGRFLRALDCPDPSVLVGPRVGEDVAAVSLAGEDTLVLKSDPITFATDAVGYYAMVVNANDLATCGAKPRWMLATLLFPPGTPQGRVRQVMVELQQAASQFGVSLCGGHTEITDAVTRPVVVGQLAGTVSRSRFIDKRRMRAGDQVLLTKGVAVEGTALIAREFAPRLLELGLGREEVDQCRRFLTEPGISILPEAGIAAGCKEVRALHDVTEGGVATALGELAAAGGHRIRVYPDRIPVFGSTARICKLLDLDPLGLIGSGSLLIACGPEACRGLSDSLDEAGIPVACIGQVLEEGSGVEALEKEGGRPVPWPAFETDEIARLFTG